MHVLAQAFWLPKEGNATEEYEDAYWPKHKIDKSTKAFHFAVADGATETSFSGIWARMLVRAYCKRQLGDSRMAKILPGLQREWFEQVSTKPLPWYAEEKLRSGAFSSIVGLTLNDGSLEAKQKCSWQAMAIGDSCFFQLRGDSFIYSFPLERSDQFNNRPLLLSSNPNYNNNLKDNIFRRKGFWEIGDEFYIMTDALACWFLKSIENNNRPRDLLRDINTPNEFAYLIKELRTKRLICNDDVTLLRVETP